MASMERGVSSPKHRQAFHQLRELLKMLVDGALHAGFAQMKIAQRNQFAQSFVALAADREIRRF